MLKGLKTLFLTLCFAVTTVFAGDLELTPSGFELDGKTDLSLDTKVSAKEPKLRFWFAVSGDYAGKTVTGSWIAEDVGDAAPPESVIDKADVTLTAEEKSAVFTLHAPPTGWPLGTYRLEVRAGERLVQTQKFEIVAGS